MDDTREPIRTWEEWTLTSRAEKNLRELQELLSRIRAEGEDSGSQAARHCRQAVLERCEALAEQLAQAYRDKKPPPGALERLKGELYGDRQASALYSQAVYLVSSSIRPPSTSLLLDDRDLADHGNH